MTDRATQLGLLRALVAEPDAEETYQVYADWLEDQGDPLAELLRVQRRLSARTCRDAERRTLELREQELAHGLDPTGRGRVSDDRLNDDLQRYPDWSYVVNDGLVTLRIHRLPPEGAVPVPPREWLDRFGYYFLRPEGASWGDKLPLGDRGLAALLDSPLMERCIGLDFHHSHLGPKRIRILTGSAAASRLLRLVLRGNRIGVGGAVALAESPHFSALLALNVSGNRLTDEGVAALASSANLAQLRILDLHEVGAAAAGLQSLARSAHLQSLTDLHYGFNRPDAAALAALAAPSALPGLRCLHLRSCKLRDEMFHALPAGGFIRLEVLDLEDNGSLTDAGIAALIRSPALAGLHTLRLGRTKAGVETMRALAENDRFFRSGSLALPERGRKQVIGVLADTPHASLLEELSLTFSRLTDKEVARLARSPHLKNLRRLDLSYNSITAAGVALLTDLAAFPRLGFLELDHNAVDDEGALALARWTHEHKLENLNLCKCDMTVAGVERLVRSPWLAGLRRLDLAVNPIGDTGAELLASCPGLSELEDLSLHQIGLTERGALALAQSPHLPAGMELCLFDNPGLTDPALRALHQRFAKVWPSVASA
jgi:uncharacterized protein (TIGR02996 family)